VKMHGLVEKIVTTIQAISRWKDCDWKWLSWVVQKVVIDVQCDEIIQVMGGYGTNFGWARATQKCY
jgi:hypothetical protein